MGATVMSLRNYLAAFAAALLLGIAVVAIADDATTMPSAPAPKSSSRSRITAPYNLLPDLTDEQKTKIKEIHAGILEEEKQLKQKEHDAIAEILTDDQKKELEDLVSKSTLEKKATEAERRAKAEAEKAESLKNELGGGAATQPANN
jgi:Spy/CpxP family protein refolding chaperone